MRFTSGTANSSSLMNVIIIWLNEDKVLSDVFLGSLQYALIFSITGPSGPMASKR